MKIYRVRTTAWIKATDMDSAKFGFCSYVAGDLGIEGIKAWETTKDPEELENYDYEI